MKKAWLIFGILIILALIGLCIPYWVTQNPSKYNFGVSGANEIGDAIGGILSPYFSFIGSVLLAYTIYLQIEQRRDDEIKYAKEKLRLEKEAKVSNQKEFEKMIFESCMETLSKVEKKIHELNIITPDMISMGSMFTQVFMDTKSEAERLNRQVKEKQVFNEFIDSMSLFNENKITEKAYQRIFINKIDNISNILGDDNLLKWNNINRIDKLSPMFFEDASLEKYNYMNNVFLESFKIKSNYQNNHDSEFQKDEIEQLKETLAWFDSFEVDLRNYFKLKSDLPTALDMGDGPILNNDNRNSYNDIKAEMKAIEDKYNLNDPLKHLE